MTIETRLFDLSGKVALVTGAASGIGLAISSAFAAHGAVVVMSDRDEAALRTAARSIASTGATVHEIIADVGNQEDIDTLAANALRLCDRIDLLVCNAGTGGTLGPLLDASDADWQQVIQINVRSVVQLCAKLIPGMAERGGGSVILTSSISGLRGNKTLGLYGLSKAAVAQVARNLAVEWGPKNVRVNSIAPGVIRTPMVRDMLANEAVMERRLSLTPLRRVGEPHEVAGPAVLLASRAGAFINGQNLVVDGGTIISDGS